MATEDVEMWEFVLTRRFIFYRFGSPKKSVAKIGSSSIREGR